MKKVEVFPAGFKVYDDNGTLIGYERAAYGEGFVYKDEEAFRDDDDEICYISENAEWDGDFMPVEDAKTEGETRSSIRQKIDDEWGEDYMLTPPQVDYLTNCVFGIADWAYIATYLEENFTIEDAIDYDDAGIFNWHQKAAVENETIPREFEYQPSYAEYVEWNNEFENAFVMDEECEGDESENGLGSNALFTYISDKQRGLVFTPEDFANIYGVLDKWKKYTTQ